LAEAWQKRRYEAHFVSKLSDSDAEQAETQHWLDTALDCKYIRPDVHASLLEKCQHSSKSCLNGRNQTLSRSDIFIDALRGIKLAKNLFRSTELDLYCSILTKKELFSKKGMKSSEKKRIEELLSRVKIIRIDEQIQKRFRFLLNKYGDKPETRVDYIIAATALAKRLPLLTRNRKHFKHITELVLSPIYTTEPETQLA
jgi:predicted nucleic acid-binding protein